jgi:hypothetical protein
MKVNYFESNRTIPQTIVDESWDRITFSGLDSPDFKTQVPISSFCLANTFFHYYCSKKLGCFTCKKAISSFGKHDSILLIFFLPKTYIFHFLLINLVTLWQLQYLLMLQSEKTSQQTKNRTLEGLTIALLFLRTQTVVEKECINTKSDFFHV